MQDVTKVRYIFNWFGSETAIKLDEKVEWSDDTLLSFFAAVDSVKPPYTNLQRFGEGKDYIKGQKVSTDGCDDVHMFVVKR